MKFQNETMKRRFMEEISVMYDLKNHPHCVSVLNYSIEENEIYIVMESCDGGDLHTRIQKKGAYSEFEARAIIRQILDAIIYMHSIGIMHRDIKPENILLESHKDDITCRLSDFGLSKRAEGSYSNYLNKPTLLSSAPPLANNKSFPPKQLPSFNKQLSLLPRALSSCGSDFYLAPELIKRVEYGREVDLWSVGVLTYVLLSGLLPFHHTDLRTLYRQILLREVSFPISYFGHVTKSAKDFILGLLTVDPAKRMDAKSALKHAWLTCQSSRPSTTYVTTNTNSGCAAGRSSRKWGSVLIPKQVEQTSSCQFQNLSLRSRDRGVGLKDIDDFNRGSANEEIKHFNDVFRSERSTEKYFRGMKHEQSDRDLKMLFPSPCSNEAYTTKQIPNMISNMHAGVATQVSVRASKLDEKGIELRHSSKQYSNPSDKPISCSIPEPFTNEQTLKTIANSMDKDVLHISGAHTYR